MAKFSVEEVKRADLDQLHQLIVESTEGKTKITRDHLDKDLFEPLRPSRPLLDQVNKSIDFALDQAATDSTACRAIVAKTNDGQLLGYLLFSYFYAPWVGRYVDLVDLYTQTEKRRIGVAKTILKYLVELSEREGYQYYLLNASDLPDELKSLARDLKITTMRNEDSDWSVYRIEFKNIRNN